MSDHVVYTNLDEVPVELILYSEDVVKAWQNAPELLKDKINFAGVKGSLTLYLTDLDGKLYEDFGQAQLNVLCQMQKEQVSGKDFTKCILPDMSGFENFSYIWFHDNGDISFDPTLKEWRDYAFVLPMGQHMLGTWESQDLWDSMGTLEITIYDVVTLKPFGDIDTGEIVTRLCDYEGQTVELSASDGERSFRFKFDFVEVQ